VNSCLVPAMEADNQEIITIEGLAMGTSAPDPEGLCGEGGYAVRVCTPGMIMSAKALLEKTPSPSEEKIREGIAVISADARIHQDI